MAHILRAGFTGRWRYFRNFRRTIIKKVFPHTFRIFIGCKLFRPLSLLFIMSKMVRSAQSRYFRIFFIRLQPPYHAYTQKQLSQNTYLQSYCKSALAIVPQTSQTLRPTSIPQTAKIITTPSHPIPGVLE